MDYKRYNEYFHQKEFACPQTGRADMHPGFILKLTRARKHAGIPFVINSGYRSAHYQRGLFDQGLSSVRTSAHMLGRAADIKAVHGREKWVILNALIAAGFNRFGIGDRFIHVDDDPDRPMDVIWNY